MAKEIFSGKNSEKLWKDINSLNKSSKVKDIRDVIYHVCCKMQKLESKIDESRKPSNVGVFRGYN